MVTMYTNNNPKSSAGGHRHFYIKRQQFVDEIIFDRGDTTVPALSAFEKNVGHLIAKSINPATGETFESASRFARRLGAKVRHVENAMKVLAALDWLRIEQRGGRIYLSIQVRDIKGPRSTKLPGNKYEERQRQIGAALECNDLSQSAKCAYAGLLLICNKDGEWQDGQTDAARLLGMPRRTFNVAMRELHELNLVHIDGQSLMPMPILSITVDADGKLRSKSLRMPLAGSNRATTGQEVGNVESDSRGKSMASQPTPVTPLDSRYSSEAYGFGRRDPRRHRPQPLRHAVADRYRRTANRRIQQPRQRRSPWPLYDDRRIDRDFA